MSIYNNLRKEILSSTHLLINGYIKQMTLLNIPKIIIFWIKIYYQQKDSFAIMRDYTLSNGHQTALRHYDYYYMRPNDVYATAIGIQTIDYAQEMIIHNNSKFTWKIRIDMCPSELDIGIIDKSVLDKDNEPLMCTQDVPFTAQYGIDEAGLPRYIENPTSKFMYPIIGSWQNAKRDITNGDIICIELHIKDKNGNIKFWINGNDALEYPWVYNQGKYGVYIKMKEAQAQCSILQYQCEYICE